MSSNPPLNLFTTPILMWSRLAWKAGEMALAAAQVIGHRTGRLANAGAIPSARDQREFALMGQEKGAAALESALAMGRPMLMLNQQFAMLAFKHMTAALASLMSIATSRTAGESAERQTKLVRDTMTRSAVAAAQLSGAAARVVGSALKPVHERVSGNVTRLGKR